jgi:uncharacterized protein
MMDVRYELNGTLFVWDDAKARSNIAAHEGVAFEQAAEVFFDPFLRIVDASRNDEARDAVIGYDVQGRLLVVVHV